VRINIGSRICAERQAKRLSQADLERRCGLARCRISWLEHGRAVPTIETLERISDALEIPVYRLLCESDELTEATKASAKIATNGGAKRRPTSVTHLHSELCAHLGRMREDDRYLLLFIARQMAGRVPGRSGVARNNAGAGTDGATIRKAVGAHS
jgi:transcriptional regulator with XRE-family HTH domain